jgi:hypothetical protein
MNNKFTKIFDIISKTKGDVLDIGFGWGISANHFYNNGVKSLTIIEKRKDVYQKALEWAKDKQNVHLHYGDWIDVVPSLNKKFDGIYMDTISPENENFSLNKTKEDEEKLWEFYHTAISKEEWDKYKSFEDYSKTIANENCILCIFEYVKFRKDLNKENLQVYWGSDSRIPKKRNIGFTYFVAGEFRKDKFYESKQVLDKDFCKSLILDNIDNLKLYSAEREIDNILHKRSYRFTKLKYNKKFEDLLNSNLFSNYKKVNLKDIYCGMCEYNEGDGYDRHVETVKGMPLDDKEQYRMTYDFTLNDDYEGGEVEIYDEWYKNDRETFSEVKPNVGECLIYKPYQHITYKTVTKNKKYQILVVIKNKDLKKNLI